MEPQIVEKRFSELKRRGFDTFRIIRQLRQEFALSIGRAKEIMVRHETGECLTDHQGELIGSLIRAFEDAGLPEYEFEIDDEVETVGAKHSFRRGQIRDRIWHHKDEMWYYYLVVGGRKVSKRYSPSDLQRTSSSE